MKITLLITLMLVLVQCVCAETMDFGRFIHAMACVESGNDPQAVGPFGELTAYQFCASTWGECGMRYPFSALGRDDPHTCLIARLGALNRAQFLAQKLTQRGWAVTPYNLALLWRRPYGRTFTPGMRDYAVRVAGIYSLRATD